MTGQDDGVNLTAAEYEATERDGYLLREAVLSRDEVRALIEVVEEVAATVTARAERPEARPADHLGDGHRIQFSSKTAIQWEWAEGSRQIRLLEPAHHLDERIEALFADGRLTTPASEMLGVDGLSPFTSKLNFKRAREGSEFPFHQDFPYWYCAAGLEAADVVTAIVFLDDADRDNGAVRVVPGSHKLGPVRRNPEDPTRFLTDPTAIDAVSERVIEVAAGSVIWFGAYLVHRSSPNTSGRHRRALLPSWQPAGRPMLQQLEYRPELVGQLP